jgi:hypothetical protein
MHFLSSRFAGSFLFFRLALEFLEIYLRYLESFVDFLGFLNFFLRILELNGTFLSTTYPWVSFMSKTSIVLKQNFYLLKFTDNIFKLSLVLLAFYKKKASQLKFFK